MKNNFLLFLILPLLHFTAVASYAQTKKVFAHYMVCNKSYGNGTVEGYKLDIKDAQAMGIDGFALNAGAWDANYKRNMQRLFQAASELNNGFTLFFSADGCCGLPIKAVEDVLTTYINHPNYFKYGERPFLSAWSYRAGENAKILWTGFLNSFKVKGYHLYFIPYLFNAEFKETPDFANVFRNYNATWKFFLDGYFYFGAAGLPGREKQSLLNSSEALAKVFHEGGQTYMATVSPYYWGGKQIPDRRYYEFRGGEGIAEQWKSIIEVQKPEWVQLVTWNDWDEGSYFSPMDDINKHWPWAAHKQLGFYKTHKGFAELNRYYIDWYKSGVQPPVKTDQIYFFYRTHPKDAIASKDPNPVKVLYGDVKDEIYVTTILKSSATLNVFTGSVKKKYEVKAGIQHTSIPFNTGSQYFEIRRNGKQVIYERGEDINAEITEYNFNVYSGSGTRKLKVPEKH
jgi:glucan endo-1,3-alpha-glucosidase